MNYFIGTELCHTKAVKEQIFRLSLLKSTLVREVKQLKVRWVLQMTSIKKRHQIETKKLKAKSKLSKFLTNYKNRKINKS